MSRDGILLLGGGFIASSLASRLAVEGRQVHMIARSMPALLGRQGINVHQGDLSDPALLGKLLLHCGTIVHSASATLPGSSARFPMREQDNLIPTLRLLEYLQASEGVHVIFLSSGGTVYGNPTCNPIAEQAPLAPLSYHGAGKVALEAFFQAFRTAGHSVTILRPSNAYGIGQGLRTGFGLIRTLLERVRNGEPVEIWGDGENVRDFIYIDDVVEACTRFIDLPDDSDTYNLGSGRGYTINQVLRLIETVCSMKVEAVYRPARRMDVREIVLDIAKLKVRLAWRPQIALEDGTLRTWNWLREA